MEEFFPVLLAAAFAIAISLYTGGVAPWWVLSCVAVAASGLAATTFTGEFDENWLYLLQDLGEAAVGLTLGLAVVRWVLPGSVHGRGVISGGIGGGKTRRSEGPAGVVTAVGGLGWSCSTSR